MPEETHKPKKQPGGWSAARQHLATWDKPALLALMKDLYAAAAENRDFIQARCQAEDGSGEVLEKYRQKVIGQFFSNKAHGMGDLKLGEARKAIRDYKKATGNIPGTAELLMTYVESGVEFTHQYPRCHRPSDLRTCGTVAMRHRCAKNVASRFRFPSASPFQPRGC